MLRKCTNDEIRDREKIVRGVQREDNPLIKELQIYLNCVRPHMALDGRTRSEAAGIQVKGRDIVNANPER